MLALAGRPVDEHVAQAPRRTRVRPRAPPRQRAGPGAGVDDHVRVGPAELAPPPVERAGHDRAEQRTDLGAGEEVAAPAGPRRRDA